MENLGIYISIHAPHAGRDVQTVKFTPEEIISIHAPHAGRDLCSRKYKKMESYFNPRAPCGARRAQLPRASRWRGYFNPRAPCGARP